MTDIPNGTDLQAIAGEAEVELEAAEELAELEALEALGQESPRSAYDVEAGTVGYYEAELRSLRDAATTLGD